MIRKRQIRFIVTSMSVLFVVLTTILVVLGISSYRNVVKDADRVLGILSENKGRFPMENDKYGHPLPPDMSPEIPYESRYFSTVLNAETESVIYVETSRIIAINTTLALEFTKNALEGDDSGFIENFRYKKYAEGNILRITFLDCGRKLDAMRGFIFNSASVILVGYLVVFVLVMIFSQRIMQPMNESYEKQKRFITDAGHEIKTPLTIIQADVDVLEMEFGENEWLDDIKRQAKRLAALTNDLVYLARMEEAETKLQMVEFSLSDAVKDATMSFQAIAKSQGIHFNSQIQPMLSLKGNEQAIQQLVTILLDNAVKYCTKEGKVSLTLERQGKQAKFSVYNTTEHVIPKENLEVIFERFYRSDPSRNSETGGHGIGLSIAKAIVNAHSGKIQVKASDEHALEMIVLLPM